MYAVKYSIKDLINKKKCQKIVYLITLHKQLNARIVYLIFIHFNAEITTSKSWSNFRSKGELTKIFIVGTGKEMVTANTTVSLGNVCNETTENPNIIK